MTGSEIYACLKLLGHTDQPYAANTDEATAAGIIMRGWTDCPYDTADAMLDACQPMLEQVQSAAAAQLRKAALASLDPIVTQIQRYEILGEDSTQARAKLVAAMAKIDADYPQGS